MEKDGDGTNTVPEENRKIVESLSFPTEQVQGLLPFLRNSEVLDVLYNGCKLLLVVGGGVGFIGIGEGGVILIVEV